MRHVLGLVPARGGSKGIPLKNLAPLAGRPLLSWTLDAAGAAPSLTRVVVSTDDDRIAQVAEQEGVAVLRRPADISGDAASALDVVRHALQAEREAGRPVDVVAYLQPTSPLRTGAHVEQALAALTDDVDTVVTVVRVPHRYLPDAVFGVDDGWVRGPGPGNRRRQDVPELWARNGPAVLAVRAGTVLEEGRLYGARVRAVPMDPLCSVDVDGPDDLELAEALLLRAGLLHDRPGHPTPDTTQNRGTP